MSLSRVWVSYSGWQTMSSRVRDTALGSLDRFWAPSWTIVELRSKLRYKRDKVISQIFVSSLKTGHVGNNLINNRNSNLGTPFCDCLNDIAPVAELEHFIWGGLWNLSWKSSNIDKMSFTAKIIRGLTLKGSEQLLAPTDQWSVSLHRRIPHFGVTLPARATFLQKRPDPPRFGCWLELCHKLTEWRKREWTYQFDRFICIENLNLCAFHTNSKSNINFVYSNHLAYSTFSYNTLVWVLCTCKIQCDLKTALSAA